MGMMYKITAELVVTNILLALILLNIVIGIITRK